MLLKPPLKQRPAVGTFQCPACGAALKHWRSLLGSAHHTKYHTTPAQWGRGAGTPEASRDGEDNHRATIAWEGLNLPILLPTTLHQHLHSEGLSQHHRRAYFLYLRCVLIISGNLITKEFFPAPSLMWFFLCFLREIRARLTFLSGA